MIKISYQLNYYYRNRDKILKKNREDRERRKKINQYNKEYSKNNEEKLKEYHREYYKKNKEKIIKKYRKYGQEYYLKNREKMRAYSKEYCKEYYKKNRDKILEKCRNKSPYCARCNLKYYKYEISIKDNICTYCREEMNNESSRNN